MLFLISCSGPGTSANHRDVEGYCGKTSTDRDVKSDDDACKSFFQTASTPKSLAVCALHCTKCSACRYATFSHHMRDCSLYEECDLGQLAQGYGYQTRDMQGVSASALAQTPSPLPPPPSPPFPPPLPPREPGDWRDAACLEPAKGKQPAFAVFGGSNSAGTNSLRYVGGGDPIVYGPHIPSFADELMRRLPAFQRSDRAMAGGMGPTAAAACVGRFAPAETRLATVEFLPNIGYIKDDRGELESIGELLRALRRRGAATYVVDIISGSLRFERERKFQGWCGQNLTEYNESSVLHGCNTRHQILRLHGEITKLTHRYGATLITVDADETPHLFGADFFHINMAGHRHVANSIWRDFKQLPCAAFRPAALGHGGHATGMECAIAEDLDLLVGRRSSGFERVNLGQDRGVSKIGYDATAPGASLDLCVDLPRQAVQDALSELAKVTVQRSGVNAYDPSRAKERLLHGDAFALSVGIQTSHPKNLPLHGRVRRAPTYIF